MPIIFCWISKLCQNWPSSEIKPLPVHLFSCTAKLQEAFDFHRPCSTIWSTVPVNILCCQINILYLCIIFDQARNWVRWEEPWYMYECQVQWSSYRARGGKHFPRKDLQKLQSKNLLLIKRKENTIIAEVQHLGSGTVIVFRMCHYSIDTLKQPGLGAETEYFILSRVGKINEGITIYGRIRSIFQIIIHDSLVPAPMLDPGK